MTYLYSQRNIAERIGGGESSFSSLPYQPFFILNPFHLIFVFFITVCGGPLFHLFCLLVPMNTEVIAF